MDSLWQTPIVAMIAVTLLCAAASAQPVSPKTALAVNDIPAGAPVGERPYEMVAANRVEERKPLVDCEDLAGWSVEMYGDAECELSRSREQQMWGQHVAKVRYRGKNASDHFIVRPPHPIEIAGSFDCINLWLWGNRWSWENPPDTPPVSVTVSFVDATGKDYQIPLTSVQWQEWWLVHRRLGTDTLAAIKLPCQFTGIEFRGGSNADWRNLYFDSLSFYTETLAPLHFEPRPQRNLTLFDGQPQGQNTGTGKLDFPTREETILPTNVAKGYKTAVRVVEARSAGVSPANDGGRDARPTRKAYEFEYTGPDGKVMYRLDPAAGLSGIEAFVNGQRVAQPMREGGLRFDPEATLQLKSARLQGDVLHVTYAPECEYRFRLWQKSLVIDALCRGGKATEIPFGSFAGLHNPQTIYVPFMAWTNGPQVLMAHAGSDTGQPVFATVYADWYRSNASELYVAVAQGKDTAKVNGGIRYHKKTDGLRNDVYDRIFLTVSPMIEEVLPTIANPRGLHAQQGGERTWQESWGPVDFDKEHERSLRLRAFGIEKHTQCNHEISWRDGGESFTMRTHAAPKKGGDAKQAWYVKAQRALGWMCGLYTNYTDYAPVNEHWSEDWVAREPNNEWRPAWPRNYNCKPTRANEVEHEIAPIIKERYGVNSSYTDVHTAVAPWGYNDYDARVPGAGTFAQTFYCYGELLRNDSRVYGGPIFSEGTYQMLYAGLTDGNYGHVYNGINMSQQPYLPIYDLMKIHPLEADIGISWTAAYFGGTPGWDWPQNREHSIDRFLAAEMTYGHIGWLVEDSFGMPLICRSYYMIQQLQSRYACQAPLAIDYFGGGRFMSTSEALATGTYRDSQIRITYPGGLTLWVNGSEKVSWLVTDAALPDRKGYALPPAGWIATAPGFFEYSGLREGQRVDIVQSPEYLYFDGRGSSQSALGLTCKGGLAVRKQAANRVEVIDIAETREFGLHNPYGIAGGVISAEAFTPEGKSLGQAEIRQTINADWIIGPEKATRYVVGFGTPAPALGLKTDLGVVPPGGEVHITGAQATLTCTGATVQGSTVHIPADAKPGTRVWVKGEAGGKTGWATVLVAPLVELTLRPDTVRLPDGTADVFFDGRVNPPTAAAKTAAVQFAPPAWLKIETGDGAVPVAFTLPLSFTLRAHLTLNAAPEKASAPLVATVKCGELSQDCKFTVNLAPGSAVVRRFDDPAWDFDWGIAFRNQPEQAGDNKTGAVFNRQSNTVGGITHPGLFASPPYVGGVGYSFATFAPTQLPPEPAEVHAFLGLGDGGYPSDGVDFTLAVIDATGKETKLATMHGDQKRWSEMTVDLSAFAGQRVQFKWYADCGKNDNTIADWASWGDPMIRLRKPVPELSFTRQ